MFNFKALIKQYSKNTTHILRETDGYYDYENGGVYVPGNEEQLLIGAAVMPISRDDLRLEENGTYSTEDRKMYTYNDIKLNEKIMYKEKEYIVQNKTDYSDYDSGLYIYIIKRVGESK